MMWQGNHPPMVTLSIQQLGVCQLSFFLWLKSCIKVDEVTDYEEEEGEREKVKEREILY